MAGAFSIDLHRPQGQVVVAQGQVVVARAAEALSGPRIRSGVQRPEQPERIADQVAPDHPVPTVDRPVPTVDHPVRTVDHPVPTVDGMGRRSGTTALVDARLRAVRHREDWVEVRPRPRVPEARRNDGQRSVVGGGAASVRLKRFADKAVLWTGPGDDRVQVQRRGHRLRMTVNGDRYEVSAHEVAELTLRTEDGHDMVEVDGNVGVRLRVYGGPGDDRLQGGAGNDKLFGGDGRDVIDGGAGNDLIEGNKGADNLRGGPGHDVLYGLDGADILWGGEGADYIDGGRGRDLARGGAGADTVIGGLGADMLWGDAGEDVVAGGQGQDRLSGGADPDRLLHDPGETMVHDPTDTVEVVEVRPRLKGKLGVAPDARSIAKALLTLDPTTQARIAHRVRLRLEQHRRFASRTASDLDALNAFPEGQRLLSRLASSPGKVSIYETQDELAGSFTAELDGGEVVVGYEPNRTDRVDGREAYLRQSGVSVAQERRLGTHRPPVVALGHELIHALHEKEGTVAVGRFNTHPFGAMNEELKTTGFPYDDDQDARTPPRAPTGLTENSLRKDMGLALRQKYYFGSSVGDGGGANIGVRPYVRP